MGARAPPQGWRATCAQWKPTRNALARWCFSRLLFGCRQGRVENRHERARVGKDIRDAARLYDEGLRRSGADMPHSMGELRQDCPSPSVKDCVNVSTALLPSSAKSTPSHHYETKAKAASTGSSLPAAVTTGSTMYN